MGCGSERKCWTGCLGGILWEPCAVIDSKGTDDNSFFLIFNFVSVKNR